MIGLRIFCGQNIIITVAREMRGYRSQYVIDLIHARRKMDLPGLKARVSLGFPASPDYVRFAPGAIHLQVFKPEDEW